MQDDCEGGSGVSASLEAIPKLARLLAVQQYTGPLLEGLIASVGGVDASLAKVASVALVEVLASSEATGQQQQQELLRSVAESLLEIWGRHARTTRMSGPLLKTADLLVTRIPEIVDVCVIPPAAPDAVATPAPAPVGPASAPDLTAPGDASSPASGPAAGDLAAKPFPDLLVALVRAEARQCTDVSRLLDSSSLLCHLLICSNPCQVGGMQGLSGC